MTAPDRIRVAQDADGFWTCREAVSGSQEYVRADLYAALEAENGRLRNILRRLLVHADADKFEGDGWLPIESAPKDGTYVLACRAHRILPLIIRFDKKYGEWESEQGDHVYNILGWRPLPIPPEAAK